MPPSLLLADLRAAFAARDVLRFGAADDAAAAVAAVLRTGPEGAEILLIRRARREGDPWSGHVAFPGGKRDATDTSLLATSIRETREEVGLTLDPSGLLARLANVGAGGSAYPVAEFVFAIDDPLVSLRVNVEVEDAFWVPLRRIVEKQGKETMTRIVAGERVELPCVRLGEHVLWGMTHRMVMQIVAAAGAEE